MALVPFYGIYGRTEVRHLRRAAATASTREMLLPNFQVTGYGLRATGHAFKRCYELRENGYGLWNYANSVKREIRFCRKGGSTKDVLKMLLRVTGQ